jgi:uncharacterized protein YqjF (DUF2071 family)
MAIEDLRFTSALLSRPMPKGWAVETTLEHFAIVTYRVDPVTLQKLLHPRFRPVCLADGPGSRYGMVSVVTFLDRNFRFVACPWLRRSFGQTNYRAYVEDTQCGEHVAWFFGTCLDSASVVVPRHVWRLPWHRARMLFDCRYDREAGRYSVFTVHTRSRWASDDLIIEDSGEAPSQLSGTSNLEAGLVLLTHPLRGTLGSYRIWHDRTQPTVGVVQEASYPLLQCRSGSAFP